ncbi:MAG: hypothetical protein KIT15_04775 [Xanthobacteraceae bacterium]|nr:hypothetical protein [Xanthobacteraceae bacterium]MCW5673874.1 hypothetical protein [Xanthobacteraceae bacterium]
MTKNPHSLFLAIMLAVGLIVALALWAQPSLNAFDFMPFITIFVAMGLAELALMFGGKLIGPMPLNMRLIGLAFGVGVYLVVSQLLKFVPAP